MVNNRSLGSQKLSLGNAIRNQSHGLSEEHNCVLVMCHQFELLIETLKNAFSAGFCDILCQCLVGFEIGSGMPIVKRQFEGFVLRFLPTSLVPREGAKRSFRFDAQCPRRIASCLRGKVGCTFRSSYFAFLF
jgi:hypothetical protein